MPNELPYHPLVPLVADWDVRTVLPRDLQYQGSWQKRGGAGVFANLARKWDRIEAASRAADDNIEKAFLRDVNPTGLIDDIRDLRRYLLLLEAWLQQRHPTLLLWAQPDRQGRVGVVVGGGQDTGIGGYALADATKSVPASGLHEHDPHDQMIERRTPGLLGIFGRRIELRRRDFTSQGPYGEERRQAPRRSNLPDRRKRHAVS